ncbi:MAG: hypothetical protein N2645_09420 [Clostridia bacterium]|nr:hypothetical protein [Clostridia bacterium]
MSDNKKESEFKKILKGKMHKTEEKLKEDQSTEALVKAIKSILSKDQK